MHKMLSDAFLYPFQVPLTSIALSPIRWDLPEKRTDNAGLIGKLPRNLERDVLRLPQDDLCPIKWLLFSSY